MRCSPPCPADGGGGTTKHVRYNTVSHKPPEALHRQKEAWLGPEAVFRPGRPPPAPSALLPPTVPHSHPLFSFFSCGERRLCLAFYTRAGPGNGKRRNAPHPLPEPTAHNETSGPEVTQTERDRRRGTKRRELPTARKCSHTKSGNARVLGVSGTRSC